MELKQLPVSAPSRQIPKSYDALLEFFPIRFDFFGLGRLEMAPKRCALPDVLAAPMAVTFQVSGEESGLCIVSFDVCVQGEEAQSMAQELANVLASKFVTQLADSTSADISISPPTLLEAGAGQNRYLAATLKTADEHDGCARLYQFIGQGLGKECIKLLLAYLPASREGLA